MKAPGQVVVFRFPQTNLQTGKPRPALLIAKAPGHFDDWLTCPISTQLHQAIENMDEILNEGEPDYAQTGLKTASVIRLSRLSVIDGSIFEGAIGSIAPERLQQLKARLAKWILE